MKIFVASSTYAENNAAPMDLLRGSGYEYTVNRLGRRLSREELIQGAGGADGIIAGLEVYDDFVLEALSRLRCISRCGVGMDNIDLKKAGERNIKIFNTPGVVVQPVAELTIGLIFDLLRKISSQSTHLKGGFWKREPGLLLAGKRVGILGLGQIGRRVAKMLMGLGAKVSGYDIFPDEDWAHAHGVSLVEPEGLLKTSDIITIHLSVLPQAPFQLGEREIRLMKKGACLVNVSRGQFIDEGALYAALKDGHLRAAALDVYAREPYRGNLTELDNIILTPHIGTLTEESRLQMEVEATENVIRFLGEQSK